MLRTGNKKDHKNRIKSLSHTLLHEGEKIMINVNETKNRREEI